MPTKEIINNRLFALYGNHVETDKPLFRVAFSDDETEMRQGEFWTNKEGTILYPSPVIEVRELKKYDYLDGQWVLEVLTFVPFNKETASGYRYEPLWAWDKGLPLNWNAVERVVYTYINKIKSNVPRNQKEAEYQESERLRKAKQTVKNRLDNTALQSALHDGDAVSLAGIEVPKS